MDRYALKIFAVLLLCSALGSGATFTANTTGNWNSSATWSGAGVPTSADGCNINGDIVVTIPSGVTAQCNVLFIGNTANSTGTSTLINNGTLQITATTGQMRCGQGTGKDAKLIFGPGSVTTINASASLYIQNCQVTSTATANSFAVLNGAGQVTTTGVSGPTQDWNTSYLSVQTTGSFSLVLQSTTGSYTSEFVCSHCVFAGVKGLALGSATSLSSTPISIDRSDIRDVGATNTITYARLSGGSATFALTNSTFRQSGASSTTITNSTSSGLTVTGNVIVNGIVICATPGNCNVSDNFMVRNVANVGAISGFNGSTGTETYCHNYLLQEYDPTYLPLGNNFHPIGSSGAASTGTRSICRNILETVYDNVHYTFDRPDLNVPGATPLATHEVGNVILNCGNFWSGPNVTACTTNQAINNNLIWGQSSCTGTEAGKLFQPEQSTTGVCGSGVSLSANVELGNNIANEYAVTGPNTSGTQTITSDYNTFYNMGGGAYNGAHLSIGSLQPHDQSQNPLLSGTAPRGIAGWNQIWGSGTNSGPDGITCLLGINGYRGSPNFDQGGTPCAHGPAKLLTWVGETTRPRMESPLCNTGPSIPSQVDLNGDKYITADRGPSACRPRTIAALF